MAVREEQTGDVASVARVHREAFADRGAAIVALVDDLRERVKGEGGLSLVAETDAGVVGHAMFSSGWLDAPARLVPVQILGPVGVRPAFQRHGNGSRLIASGLEMLASRGVPAVFLEGDPGYYGRLGFRPAGPLGFRKPSVRIPDAAFQVRTLPAHEAWMTGALVYPEAFWAPRRGGTTRH